MNERNRNKRIDWDTIKNLCAVLGAVASLSGVIAVGTWFFGIPYRVGTNEAVAKDASERVRRCELELSEERIRREALERRMDAAESRILDRPKLNGQ